jgi:hypothetical protein
LSNEYLARVGELLGVEFALKPGDKACERRGRESEEPDKDESVIGIQDSEGGRDRSEPD